MMDQAEIYATVQAQLAVDLNCTLEELNGEKDRIVFVQAKEREGRRPFPWGEQHFEMLSMGKTIVVSATEAILQLVQPLLEGKGRDEAFNMPFVYGHSLYYLPDLRRMTPCPAPGGFCYELIEQSEIPTLYQTPGFNNAISYDVHHPRPDVLALAAKREGRIIGIAGASKDCAKLWQVGIDVLPAYRGLGLAAFLVNALAQETLRRGFVPYYGTASSNIPSQRVAHRAGYFPAWICCYRGNFEPYKLLPIG